MPQNRKAYEVLQYVLAGCEWRKGEGEKVKPIYKPSDILRVMDGLEIVGRKTFLKVSNCLLTLSRDE